MGKKPTLNAFHFKTTNSSGRLAKHYVVYRDRIDIYTLVLSAESEADNLIKQGFQCVKTFKGLQLLCKPVHFKTSTFFTIAEGIVRLEQLKDNE